MTSINRSSLMPLAVLAAFTICYADVIATVVDVWSTKPVYSYGFAVPLISGYLLWARSKELRAVEPRPDYLFGSLVTLSGIFMLVLGQLGALESLQQISVIVTMAGCILLVFGRSTLKLTWFPIAYLLLAIPVWDRVIDGLQAPSQLLSARVAVALLHLCGLPVASEGTQVVLPNVTLEVLAACSGVNQLTSIAAMALPAAQLWLTSRWRRAALMVAAVFVAYFSNGLRICLVGVLAYYGWSEGHIGTLHVLEGLAVALVGYALLFACLSLLSRGEQGRQARVVAPASAERQEPRLTRLAWLAVVLILVSASVFRMTFRPTAVRLADDLRALPARIDDWAIEPVADSASGFRLARVDDELVRTYRNPSGERIRLYIGYHQYQSEGKEVTDSANEGPSMSATSLRIPLDSETIELNEAVQRRAGIQTGSLFWYDLNGRIVANRHRAKGYVILDALTRGRTNGAVVMVGWEAPAGAQFDATRQVAIEFVRALLPILPRYIPS